MEPDARTELYGVLGHPVRHSRSPAVMNAAFRAAGRNAVYLAFDVASTAEGVRAFRALGLRGMSVTIPHKVAALDHVDALDESAKIAGALNTLAWDGDRLVGYNFDGAGALVPLRAEAPDYAASPVLFLGAGGSARGIALAMRALDRASRFVFAVRDPAKAEAVAGELRARGADVTVVPLRREGDGPGAQGAWGEALATAGVIVNTTPLGMAPATDTSPMTAADFAGTRAVIYDIVYNPLTTKFLRDAADAGRRVLPGAGMFLGQAALQFRLWTGAEPPAGVMERAFLASFEHESGGKR